MKSNKAYPYPVLGNGDDIIPLPEIISSAITQEGESYRIVFLVSLENPDIEDLVNNGLAFCSCEVSCSRTMMRRVFKETKISKSIRDEIGHNLHLFNFEVRNTDVAERIRINITIAATNKIPGYVNRYAHPDYAGATFDIEAGDVLALLGSFDYNVDLKYEQLKAVQSIVEIDKDEHSDYVHYDHLSQKLRILLPTTLYEDYRCNVAHQTNWAPVLHSSILLSALTHALRHFYDYSDSDEDLPLWWRAIDYRLRTEKDLPDLDRDDPDSADHVAQALLANPFKRLFSKHIDIEK